MSRVATVTGGAAGLGRAIAERLAKDGFTVAILDLDVAEAERVAGSFGGAHVAVECDVASYEAVTDAARAIDEELGGTHVLINNAGFDDPGFFLETNSRSWKRLLDVNLTGVLNCCHVFAPGIADRARDGAHGRIVNIASDAGRVGSLGEAVYSAAKGGVIAFTKSLARELARDRVTVNAVCPGPADTPMTDRISATELGQKMMTRMVAGTPLRRLVAPDEVADAVAYFAGESAAFTTGQVLSVSGGLTMV